VFLNYYFRKVVELCGRNCSSFTCIVYLKCSIIFCFQRWLILKQFSCYHFACPPSIYHNIAQLSTHASHLYIKVSALFAEFGLYCYILLYRWEHDPTSDELQCIVLILWRITLSLQEVTATRKTSLFIF